MNRFKYSKIVVLLWQIQGAMEGQSTIITTTSNVQSFPKFLLGLMNVGTEWSSGKLTLIVKSLRVSEHENLYDSTRKLGMGVFNSNSGGSKTCHNHFSAYYFSNVHNT